MNPSTAPSTVVPAHYPELRLLAWNRDPERAIPAAEALALYEANWRHIDIERMTREEADFIDALVREHGNGHSLTA